jgi:hypothetical protein
VDLAIRIDPPDADPRPEPLGPGHDDGPLHDLSRIRGAPEEGPVEPFVILAVDGIGAKRLGIEEVPSDNQRCARWNGLATTGPLLLGRSHLGDRSATIAELSEDDRHSLLNVIDGLVTKSRIRTLAGGVS